MNNELTIATVNFNTPTYLMPLTNSLRKSNPWYIGKINVYDNGDVKTIEEGETLAYIGHFIDNDVLYKEFNTMKEPNDPGCRHFCSAKHCKTIDYIIKNTKTKYILICDTDVIFTKNFKELFETFKNENYAVCSYIKKPNGYSDRLAPWFTFMDIEQLENNNINYYDEKRMLFVNGNNKDDTGAVLLQDCIKNDLKILEIPEDNYYYYHFKGGSYLPFEIVKKWLMKYKEYWS